MSFIWCEALHSEMGNLCWVHKEMLAAHQPHPNWAAVGSCCWWVCHNWLSHVRLLCSPLHWGWRKSTQLPHMLSEVMDWLWILLTRTVVEGFCRRPGSGQDSSRCWSLPEASFRQAESSLSVLPVMTLDEKTFSFKQWVLQSKMWKARSHSQTRICFLE